MPLASALVDRARIIRSVPSSVKVEGRTTFTQESLAWFRCRVTVSQKRRAAVPSEGASRAEFTPSLMLGVKDTDGQAIDLSIRDRVEVRSASLGLDGVVFEVTADPEPIRKKRKVIGWMTVLKKVEQHSFEEQVA